VQALLFALLFSAFLLRVNQEIVQPDYYSDKAWQIQASYNILHGLGFSRSYADINDLSRNRIEFILAWPPGYSLLLALVNLIIKDLLRSAFALEILAIAILLFAVHKLAALLTLDSRVYALLLASLCLPAHFIDRLTTTDLLSLSAFQLGIYLALQGIKQARGPVFFAAVGLVCFLAGFLRYAYYPVLFVVPFSLIIIGVNTRDKSTCAKGLISASTASACLIGLWLFQVMHSTTAWSPTQKLSPKPLFTNLLHLNNFTFDTFYSRDESFGLDLLRREHVLNDESLTFISSFLALALLVMLLHHFVFQRRFLAHNSQGNLINNYCLIAFLTVVLNVSSLAYLSLRYEPQTEWTTYWTYVQENRYFAPSMLCVLLCAALVASAHLKNKRYINLPFFVIATSLLLSGINFSWCLYQRQIPPLFRPPNDDLARAGRIISEIVGRAHKKVVVLGTFDNLPLLSIRGCSIAPPERRFHSQPSIKTSQDLIVILWTAAQPTEVEKRLIEVHNGERLAELDESLLYKMTVKKNE
jgi:hypothetical protein